MSDDIYVRVMRAGIQIYASLYVQLDHMDVQEASYYGGASPYFRYNGYTLVDADIRQSDLLVDLNNIDPKTNKPYQYRSILDIENFPDHHGEMIVDRVIGT